ncbi:unnamed protein product [Medioppia subpectinata]|uniref:Uncharacterized protein n=1 Tax=Medioppia subpectinata TaxID=1979941 RepID=A0A7R9LBG4_9ACAR|nr:unnamed protein product [Medioppia subpectinata]CAG2117451.1 unnamed protein product [Medioppia subpectinata]
MRRDLGSDVITLFADNTVYQLTVNTTDPINPFFRYNRSQPLNKWSSVRLMGPINEVGDYSMNGNCGQKTNDRIRSKLYLNNDYTMDTIYWVKSNNSYAVESYNIMDKLKSDKSDNHLTIDQIRSYLSQTTAGFAFNDYFYLFAGNRVCRLNNRTLLFDDNCLTQTIAQWIGCDVKTINNGFSKYIKILIFMIILVVITALIIAFITYKLWMRSAPKGYQKYKTKPKPRDYVTISSDTESDNKSLNASQSEDPKASKSLSSMKGKRPTDLEVKSNEGSVKSNEGSVGSVGTD